MALFTVTEGASTLATEHHDPSGSLALDVIAPATIVHANKAIFTRPRSPSTTTLTTLADAPIATTASTAKLRQKLSVFEQKLLLCQAWQTWTSSRSLMSDAMGIGTVEEATSAGATVGLHCSALEVPIRLTCIDDNDNYSRDRGRGPQRRRQDDAPPRRRYEEPAFPKLRRLLLNIASSPTKLAQDEAVEIAKVFGENFDDERLRNDVFNIWVQL